MAKTFTDGENLTAADVNTYLVNRPLAERIQAGAEVPVPSGSGDVNVTVTYPSPFPTGAATAVHVQSLDLPLQTSRITAKSPTGFTVRWARSSAGSYRFDYIVMTPGT